MQRSQTAVERANGGARRGGDGDLVIYDVLLGLVLRRDTRDGRRVTTGACELGQVGAALHHF